MKIKLITLMAGPEGTFSPGSVLDLTAKEAQAFVDLGYAISLESEPIKKVKIESEPEPEQRPAKKKVKPKKGR